MFTKQQWAEKAVSLESEIIASNSSTNFINDVAKICSIIEKTPITINCNPLQIMIIATAIYNGYLLGKAESMEEMLNATS